MSRRRTKARHPVNRRTRLRWYDGVTNDTLTGIYSAVLYRYASTGDAAPGFDMLGSAFLPKK